MVKAIPQRPRGSTKCYLSTIKYKPLDLLKSDKCLAEVGCKVTKNKCNILTVMQKEAEIHRSVRAASTMAKMVSLVHAKVLAKTESILCVAKGHGVKHVLGGSEIMDERAHSVCEQCCGDGEESKRKGLKSLKRWLLR